MEAPGGTESSVVDKQVNRGVLALKAILNEHQAFICG